MRALDTGAAGRQVMGIILMPRLLSLMVSIVLVVLCYFLVTSGKNYWGYMTHKLFVVQKV